MFIVEAEVDENISQGFMEPFFIWLLWQTLTCQSANFGLQLKFEKYVSKKKQAKQTKRFYLSLCLYLNKIILDRLHPHTTTNHVYVTCKV